MLITDILHDLKGKIGPSCEVSDQDLLLWLQEAFYHVVDKVHERVPDFYSDVKTTSTLTRVQEYMIPDNFEKILKVNLNNGRGFEECKPIDRFDDIPNLGQEFGDQGYYGNNKYYIRNGAIGLYPIPEANGDNNLQIWYAYSPEFNDTELKKLPPKFHAIMKYGAYSNYLDQDDQHSAALQQRQLFEKLVEDYVISLADRQVDEPTFIKETE